MPGPYCPDTGQAQTTSNTWEVALTDVELVLRCTRIFPSSSAGKGMAGIASHLLLPTVVVKLRRKKEESSSGSYIDASVANLVCHIVPSASSISNEVDRGDKGEAPELRTSPGLASTPGLSLTKKVSSAPTTWALCKGLRQQQPHFQSPEAETSVGRYRKDTPRGHTRLPIACPASPVQRVQLARSFEGGELVMGSDSGTRYEDGAHGKPPDWQIAAVHIAQWLSLHGGLTEGDPVGKVKGKSVWSSEPHRSWAFQKIGRSEERTGEERLRVGKIQEEGCSDAARGKAKPLGCRRQAMQMAFHARSSSWPQPDFCPVEA